MTAWRVQDEQHEDDCYVAIELPEIEEWAEYMRYCDLARERREIVLEFEVWLESRDKRDA